MKISVALCTYNGEKHIKEQIDSILSQTRNVDEIIVCDDLSTDRTLEILNQYSQENPNLFKIHINEVNLKSVKNFEKAISLCTGDIVFLSDQDDIWVKNKVSDYIDYFNKNTNITVLASNGYCINENSIVEEKYSVWDVPQFLKEEGHQFDYYTIITQISNIATGATMAIRREIYPDIFPFPVVNNFHHDEWIAILSSKKESFHILNDKYFYYRIHKDQQVGGVFLDKNEKQKRMLIETFSLELKNSSFKGLKKRLKKLSFAYSRNKDIMDKTEKYDAIFRENLENIEKNFKKINTFKNKQYPIHSFILKITDRLLNKRQLKK